jgi:hypothetical protein
LQPKILPSPPLSVMERRYHTYCNHNHARKEGKTGFLLLLLPDMTYQRQEPRNWKGRTTGLLFLFVMTVRGIDYRGALQLSGEQVKLVLRPPSRTRLASLLLIDRLTRRFIGWTEPRCDRCSTCLDLQGFCWYEIEWFCTVLRTAGGFDRINPPRAAISPMKLRYVSTEQGRLL